MEEKEIIPKTYRSILIKESDKSYLSFNPTRNPDPKLPDIPEGLLEIEWNKELPEDLENMIYDEATKTLIKSEALELAQTLEIERSEALQYLKETDWYIIRSIETGKKIPDDVKEKRNTKRIKANKE